VSARFRIHEGAIYLHQGDSYLVTRIDSISGTALAKRTSVAYYTEPRTVTQLHIVRTQQTRVAGRTRAYHGTVRVSERLVGYRRRQRGKEAVLVDVGTESAPHTSETNAVWWDLPQAAIADVGAAGRRVGDSLHALEHLCGALLPLFAMCDRQDIGGLSMEMHADTGKPQVFLFDAVPGGMGISETGYANLEKLWAAALETVSNCVCHDGCPACIQSSQCRSGNERLDKRGAVMLLRKLLAKR
jgi:DEAD/DEAH box helicase domain-containing protein